MQTALEEQTHLQWAATYPGLYYAIEEYSVFGFGILSFNSLSMVLVAALIVLGMMRGYNDDIRQDRYMVNFGFAVFFTLEIVVRAPANAQRHSPFNWLKDWGSWIDIFATVVMWVVFITECQSDTGCSSFAESQSLMSSSEADFASPSGDVIVGAPAPDAAPNFINCGSFFPPRIPPRCSSRMAQ